MSAKKGGYDLSRKTIYYILVVFLLFFIFVYVNNALINYQKKDFAALNELEYAAEFRKVVNCLCDDYGTLNMDKFDSKVLEGCIERPARVRVIDLFGIGVTEGVMAVRGDYEGEFRGFRKFVLVGDKPAVLDIMVGEKVG